MTLRVVLQATIEKNGPAPFTSWVGNTLVNASGVRGVACCCFHATEEGRRTMAQIDERNMTSHGLARIDQ